MYDAEGWQTAKSRSRGRIFGMQEESGGEAIFVAGQALPGSWSNTDGRDLAYVEALLASLEAEPASTKAGCLQQGSVWAAS